MKKQNKIVIGIMLGIAVVIILISFLFPSVYKGLTSGSFGKADKYKQEQMSENDIRLRSEFVQDTAKLRQMITGLIYYALFTENLSMTIDTCLTSFRLQGFDKNPANTETIHLLTDYNSFLKNNNPTIANTTRMLAAFLLRDTIAQSMDIEKNLRDFSNYVNQVNQKDSVLTMSLARIDSYLVGNKTLQKKDAEIRNLKAIRDQLVIKSTQFMALTGNKQGLGAMLSYTIQSQSQFSGIGALNMVTDGSKLVQSKLGIEEIVPARINSATLSAGISLSASLKGGVANAKDNLGNNGGSAVSAKMNLVYVCSKENLSVVLYDKPSLGFVVGSSEKLIGILGVEKMNGILCGTDPNLGALCLFSGKILSVTLNAGLLANLSSSPTLCAALSAATLNIIIPAKELSAVGLSANAFGINAPLQMGFGSAAVLGVLYANAGLQNFINANGVFSGFSSLQATSLNSQLNVR
ncbi:MAG: hypothetical protein WCI48_10220 [Bacteroidota bacterium]|jgi:hypothetical protein